MNSPVVLPRSFIISMVVSVILLVSVGLIGIVATFNRAATATKQAEERLLVAQDVVTDMAQCLLLQHVEARTITRSFQEHAARQLNIQEYDDAYPNVAPPDLEAALRDFGPSCERFLDKNGNHFRLPESGPTTTDTSIAGGTSPESEDSQGASSPTTMRPDRQGPNQTVGSTTTRLRTTTTTRRGTTEPTSEPILEVNPCQLAPIGLPCEWNVP